MTADNTIRILARPQVIPTRCDFEVDRQVLDGSAWFGNAESATGSPLPERLFQIEGVAEVLIKGSNLTVTRTDAVDWNTLARQVGAAIREHLQSGAPAISEEASARSSDDQLMRKQIEEILDREINPAIASHGGVISLLDVQDGVVYVKMGGGCQGCASSTATLKQGVEQTIRARVPGVVQVLDTTDHAAGTNPYYAAY